MYATFEQVGKDTDPTVERVSIDLPNDLKTWKTVVSNHPIVVLYIWKQSCNPCVMIKNRFEKWATSIKQRYGDVNNIVLFVKDCLDQHGPVPPDGTPSFVHNRMANMVPYFIIYFNNNIVFKHAGFESGILENFIDMCMTEYQETLGANPPPPAESETVVEKGANIQFYS